MHNACFLSYTAGSHQGAIYRYVVHLYIYSLWCYWTSIMKVIGQ